MMNHYLHAAILIPAGTILYLLCVCASDALESLSGGRARKLEETDKDLAEKLDLWLSEYDLLHTFLRFLTFLFTAVTAVEIFFLLYGLSGSQERPLLQILLCSLWAVILLTFAGDLLSRVLMPRCDLGILKMTMPCVHILARICLFPLRGLYRSIENAAEKWKEANPDVAETGGIEYEILDMVEDGKDEEQIEEDEKRMIKGIFELSDTSVKEIMTPRVDVFAIPASSTVEEAKKCFIETGHSRIPVYGRSIDEIRGIIYAKDFLAESPADTVVAKFMHRPIFIPETKAVDELLDEIKHTHNHFAVIIDEYGGTSGIVTFEDIIEEIIGDVFDEYDTADDAAEKPQLLPDGSVMIDARTPLSDVNELFGFGIPETEYADTIGGYICTELGRIPAKGEIYTEKGLFEARIERADGRKIQKLKITELDDEHE